jgi:hypothetical protein
MKRMVWLYVFQPIEHPSLLELVVSLVSDTIVPQKAPAEWTAQQNSVFCKRCKDSKPHHWPWLAMAGSFVTAPILLCLFFARLWLPFQERVLHYMPKLS